MKTIQWLATGAMMLGGMCLLALTWILTGCSGPSKSQLKEQNAEYRRIIAYYEAKAVHIKCDPIDPAGTNIYGYKCRAADKVIPQAQRNGILGNGENVYGNP